MLTIIIFLIMTQVVLHDRMISILPAKQRPKTSLPLFVVVGLT